jgi:hypothetical protein
MARPRILLMATASVLFWIALAMANPVPEGQTQRAKTAVSCERVDKYSTQWFLDHALPNFKGAFRDNALFYTRGMTGQAIKYAKSHKLVTLWNVWPCELYDYRNVLDNPMRCIHNDENLRTLFYENMSRAFAIKANGSATVMHSLSDYDSPPLEGIWGRVELPTIKEATNVDWLSKVKENGEGYLLFWWRFHEGVSAWLKQQSWLPELRSLRRRDLPAPPFCMQPQSHEFFDNVDW